jgi:hypothetical protein
MPCKIEIKHKIRFSQHMVHIFRNCIVWFKNLLSCKALSIIRNGDIVMKTKKCNHTFGEELGTQVPGQIWENAIKHYKYCIWEHGQMYIDPGIERGFWLIWWNVRIFSVFTLSIATMNLSRTWTYADGTRQCIFMKWKIEPFQVCTL